MSSASWAAGAALLEGGRARLHEDVRACDPAAAPANPPAGGNGTAYETQGDVLLHVYEELAQHLGQLEVTRDVLLSRQGGDGGVGSG